MTTLTLHTTFITKVLPEAPTPTYIVITIIMITRGLELSACCDAPDSTRLRSRLRQISSSTAVTVRLVRPWFLRMHNSHGQNRPPFISSSVSNTAPHTTAQHTTPATNTIAKRALADSIHLCCRSYNLGIAITLSDDIAPSVIINLSLLPLPPP